MKLAHNFALAAIMTTSPAVAQPWTTSATADSKPRVVQYEAGQVVPLRGALGYQVMVELAPDEEVKSIALGDSSAWQVSVDKARERLFLKPVRADERTNMTVTTSIRTYSFDLEALAAPIGDMPYVVTFDYTSPKPRTDDTQYVDVSAATRRLTKYRITGDQEIRPDSVSDDGRRTYISWPRSAPIPAIYGLDRSGNEVLLNGMMGTDDIYVVDSVPRMLVFRIDGRSAHAQQVFPRAKR
jgi:type IV secretion system protein VirB9